MRPLLPTGAATLGDLASVKPGYADPPFYAVRQDGKPAVVIAVSMAKGTDGLAFGEGLRAEARRIQASLPLGIEMRQIADQPEVIGEAVGEFLLKFVAALTVVLIVTFVSLGFRTGSSSRSQSRSRWRWCSSSCECSASSCSASRSARSFSRSVSLVDDAIIAIEAMAVDSKKAGIACARRPFLEFDRVPDALRHAGHGRGLSPGRHRAVDYGRICGRYFLGGRTSPRL